MTESIDFTRHLGRKLVEELRAIGLLTRPDNTSLSIQDFGINANITTGNSVLPEEAQKEKKAIYDAFAIKYKGLFDVIAEFGNDPHAPERIRNDVADAKEAIRLMNEYVRQTNAQDIEFDRNGYIDFNRGVTSTSLLRSIYDHEKANKPLRIFDKKLETLEKLIQTADPINFTSAHRGQLQKNIESWVGAQTQQEQDEHNPFRIYAQPVANEISTLKDRVDDAYDEYSGLTQNPDPAYRDRLNNLYQKINEIQSLTSPTICSPEQERYLAGLYANNQNADFSGVVNDTLLKAACAQESTLDTPGRELQLLGLSAEQIANLSDGNLPDAAILGTVRGRLSAIRAQAELPGSKLSSSDKIVLSRIIRKFADAGADDRILSEVLVGQAKEDRAAIANALKAFIKDFDRSTDYYDLEENGQPVKVNGQKVKVVEQIPFGYFRLSGQEYNSVEQERTKTHRLLEQRNKFLRNSLVQQLLSKDSVWEESSAPKLGLDKLDALKKLDVLLDEDALIEKFNAETATVDITGHESLEKRAALVSEAVSMAEFTVEKSFDDIYIDMEGITPGGDRDAKARLIKLIKTMEVASKKIMGGSEIPPDSLTIPNSVRELTNNSVTNKDYHDAVRINIRESIESRENIKLSLLNQVKLAEKIDEKEKEIEERYKTLTTPLTRGKLKLKDFGYTVNTALGYPILLTNKLSSYGATVAFAFTVGAIFFAPPLIIPAFSYWMFGMAGYFASRKPLEVTVEIAQSGMEFAITRQNIFFDAIRQISQESIEDETAILASFVVMSRKLLPRFEPGNVREQDIKFFHNKILSGFGLLEIGGEGTGGRNDSASRIRAYAKVNKWLSMGWDGMNDEEIGEVKRTVEQSGWGGSHLSPSARWSLFVSRYGAPDKKREWNGNGLGQRRINGPYPEFSNPSINKFMTEYIFKNLIPAEEGSLNDLSYAEEKIFGEGTIKLASQASVAQVKPDYQTKMLVINNMKKEMSEMMPTKFGSSKGRQYQLASKSYFGRAVLANVKIQKSGTPSAKAA